MRTSSAQIYMYYNGFVQVLKPFLHYNYLQYYSLIIEPMHHAFVHKVYVAWKTKMKRGTNALQWIMLIDFVELLVIVDTAN